MMYRGTESHTNSLIVIEIFIFGGDDNILLSTHRYLPTISTAYRCLVFREVAYLGRYLPYIIGTYLKDR